MEAQPKHQLDFVHRPSFLPKSAVFSLLIKEEWCDVGRRSTIIFLLALIALKIAGFLLVNSCLAALHLLPWCLPFLWQGQNERRKVCIVQRNGTEPSDK